MSVAQIQSLKLMLTWLHQVTKLMHISCVMNKTICYQVIYFSLKMFIDSDLTVAFLWTLKWKLQLKLEMTLTLSLTPHLQCKIGSMHLGEVYRSPDSTQANNTKLNGLLSLKEGKCCIVLGAFNYPDIDWQESTAWQDVRDFFCRRSGLLLIPIGQNALEQ